MKLRVIYFSVVLCVCMISSVQGQTVLFFDDFESGEMKSEWRAQPDTISGVIDVASGETVPRNGLFGARMGKSQDGEFVTNVLDLPLDLSGHSQVELSFWIYNNWEETQVEDGIWFSDDGGQTFEKALGFDLSSWSRGVFGQFPPLDVDQLASENGLELTNQFIIRFQLRSRSNFEGSSSGSIDGIYLDDVSVKVPQIEYTSLPFSDDFESGEYGSAWHWGNPQLSKPEGTMTPFGQVDITPRTDAPSGDNVARLGGRTGDHEVTNALDLHLDLSGHSQVELSFWIYNNWEETQVGDGIWFSDDGGQTFEKALGFDLSSWSRGVFGQFPPLDVDQLASENGLELTNQFIIRFQEHGESSFEGSSSGSIDGIYLDDVSVKVPQIEYTSLPFSDDFESGEYGSAWHWGNPQLSKPEGTMTPFGQVDITPRTDAPSGDNVARLGGRTGDHEVTNALDLHLDLSGHSQVELSFWIYNNWEETQVGDGIWFSDDGGQSFRKVFEFDHSSWSRGVFGQFPPLDVDQLASENGLELTNQFIIRFQEHGESSFEGSSSGSIDGIYLDDVSVKVPQIEYASLPFSDDFESGEYGSAWHWGNPQLSKPEGTMTPFGQVDITPRTDAPSGDNVARLGGRTGDHEVTNALDLHLDLSGHSQVELSFWIYNNREETQVEDGIWFSDDGGQAFVKVYEYEWVDRQYVQLSLNVDVLAFEKGLNLTKTFIIRFQEHGRSSFEGSSSGSIDGIYLDDVSVTGFADPSTRVRRGDVDGDGQFTVADAILTLRFAAELQTPTITQQTTADIDKDGSVTAADAVILLRLVVGLIDALPKQVVHLGEMAQAKVATQLLEDNDEALILTVDIESSGWSAGDLVLNHGIPIKAQDILINNLSGNAMKVVNVKDTGQVRLSFVSADGTGFAEPLQLTMKLPELQTQESLVLKIDGQFYNALGALVEEVRFDGQVFVLPEEYDLMQNYPNPFNPSTSVRYDLPEAGPVALRVYNVNGQVVRTLVDGQATAGRYTVTWDGRNDRGQLMGSGVYFYHLFAQESGFSATKRMVFLK